MIKLIQWIVDWAEVWALFLPMIWIRKQPVSFQPVVFYLVIALIIDLAVDLIWKFRTFIPSPFNSNNYLYNVHSVVRFLLFSLFFIRLKQPFLLQLKKIAPVIFGIFLLINFLFFENFFNYNMFSSRLLAVEAFLLLLYTLQYYLFKMNEELAADTFTPDFWIVSGLGIFVSINFFIFLLYNELTIRLNDFAVDVWTIHNVSYVIFNIFIAKAFYESRKQ
jgi:hypothetical protein